MKKLIFLSLILLFLLPAGLAVAGDNVTKTISTDQGANGFTNKLQVQGRFNISISGTWTGTVTLQRSFNAGGTWLDVATFTENIETTGNEPQNIYYRIGQKNGDYGSGTVNLRLSLR